MLNPSQLSRHYDKLATAAAKNTCKINTLLCTGVQCLDGAQRTSVYCGHFRITGTESQYDGSCGHIQRQCLPKAALAPLPLIRYHGFQHRGKLKVNLLPSLPCHFDAYTTTAASPATISHSHHAVAVIAATPTVRGRPEKCQHQLNVT